MTADFEICEIGTLERLRRCEEALRPFAEAARNAEISGRPPFEFCSAGDYEKAALTQTKPEQEGV